MKRNHKILFCTHVYTSPQRVSVTIIKPCSTRGAIRVLTFSRRIDMSAGHPPPQAPMARADVLVVIGGRTPYWRRLTWSLRKTHAVLEEVNSVAEEGPLERKHHVPTSASRAALKPAAKGRGTPTNMNGVRNFPGRL